ncbi:hypothetical protein [Pantoea sp.]
MTNHIELKRIQLLKEAIKNVDEIRNIQRFIDAEIASRRLKAA